MAAVRSRTQYRVAVVGAGIAGLTAANTLVASHKLRVNELCVLEAQSRIGGRVQTRAFSDTLPVNIEVGAAWIHGTVGNPFAELAEKFGLPLKEISARNPWLHPESCKNFLLVDRDAQLSEERVQATWQMYELLLQKLQQLVTASDASHDGKSLAQLVDMLVEQDADLHAAVESCANGRARLDFCVRLIEIWMGATAEALQLDDFVEIDLIGDDPGPHCIVPDGMERFVDRLAEPIAECIQTNVCVKSITHQDNGTDGSRGVVIECSDGRTIKADYVIVTSALGLLKAGELSFTPALPQEKHEAIQRSQMGQYMKVLVQFPQVFWQRDASFIGQLDQTLASTVSGNRLFFPLMFNYYAAKKVPVLEGVLIGVTAAQVSSLSDEQIVDAFFKQLQETFGAGIPAPVNQFITRWDQDPWAHGAYSCLTVDSSEDDPETLRRPVGSSVLFAGEATIYKYQGALQAAFTISHSAQASMASNDSLQQRIRRGEVPCRGANVGGWLVAEHWMTWDSVIWENVPSEISDKGEFATMTHLGHDQGDQRFEQHRATWIQESEIAEMKRFGLNTVRVPVGYWIMGYDPTDASNKQEWRVFAPNALKFLDQLVNDWCAKHDLAVLIDIHGAKGSQNGRDHSAPPTCGVKYWSDYPENVENTVQFACFLAARYRDSPAFLGVGLLNEPECPVDRQVLENYYKRTYAAIRSSGNDCVLTIAPFLTEQGPPSMEDFMRFPDYFNVWHEWHPYFIWGYEGQSKKQILQAVQQYGNQVGSWRGNWLLISEWSLGSPASAFPAEDRGSLKQFASAQLQALGNAHSGWTFWSWKHSDDMHNKPSGWSLRQLLRDGVIKI